MVFGWISETGHIWSNFQQLALLRKVAVSSCYLGFLNGGERLSETKAESTFSEKMLHVDISPKKQTKQTILVDGHWDYVVRND